MVENGRLERTPQGAIYKFRPLRLTRSDLEDLLEIMTPSTGHKVDATAGGYKLHAAEDLRKIRNEVISDFKASLYSSGGLVDVSLSEADARVYVSDIHNNELSGIAQRIRNHLSEHGGSSVMKLTAFPVVLPIYAAILMAGALILQSRVSWLIYLISAFAVMAIWFAWASHVDLHRHVLIYMTEAGRTSFFRRNRDQLLVAVLSAALTLGVTLLVQALSD